MERRQGSDDPARLSLGPSTVAEDTLLVLPLCCQAWAGPWERMSQLQCQAPSPLTTGTPSSTHWGQAWLYYPGPRHSKNESNSKVGFSRPSRDTFIIRPVGLQPVPGRGDHNSHCLWRWGKCRDLGSRPWVLFQLCHFPQENPTRLKGLLPYWGHSFCPAPPALVVPFQPLECSCLGVG